MKKIIVPLLLIFISACTPSNEEGVAFQEQANEIFNTNVYIPQYDNLHITSAIIETGPFGKHKDLIIEYSKQLGDKKDKEFTVKYEKNTGSEVLYGFYDGEPSVFKLKFNDGKGNISPKQIKIINDVKVEYLKMEKRKTLIASFNVEDGNYTGEFNLKELSEEKAFKIIEQIIEETN
ncbi:hypothetical protein E3U55_03455 [Filobacillus milosensis]|uniref:DUF4367 domain-containing protein n=1 Tax=Filobacillus milosensis TaxID=94137 RepID=A0A4Y8ISH9_9BACI|nr:hypothetical protein [Filobacillus milosensis]TFB23883.1 hypothetical protein E3U55_03455 [Filobacillus milosensis]